jgi:LacI family transcriptional regulator
MSAGVMGAISTLGIELPRELSLICFDDLDWMSFLRPSITAIAQPLNEMGRAAARLILARIGGDDTPIEQLVLAPRIRMRDSVTSLLSQSAT